MENRAVHGFDLDPQPSASIDGHQVEVIVLGVSDHPGKLADTHCSRRVANLLPCSSSSFRFRESFVIWVHERQKQDSMGQPETLSDLHSPARRSHNYARDHSTFKRCLNQRPTAEAVVFMVSEGPDLASVLDERLREGVMTSRNGWAPVLAEFLPQPLDLCWGTT
jgi:hypothetical protein